LGKFLQVDPKADKYGSLTTYNYAGNNPVIFNDPYGDDYDITIDWDQVPDEGYHWERQEQDYQPGWSVFSDAWAAMDRADAMFDMMNGYSNPVFNSRQYGSAGGSITSGGRGHWEVIYKDWWNSDTGEYLGTTVSRYEYVWEDAPQEGYQEINRRFRSDFIRYFFMGVPHNIPHQDFDDKMRLKMIIKNIHKVKDRYLDDKDEVYQMRALYYTIDFQDSDGKIDFNKTIQEDLIDRSEWTTDPIWANPGHLGPNNTVMPTRIETDSGAVLINIYFQRIPQPIMM
jgi:hypothetical protein